MHGITKDTPPTRITGVTEWRPQKPDRNGEGLCKDCFARDEVMKRPCPIQRIAIYQRKLEGMAICEYRADIMAAYRYGVMKGEGIKRYGE